MQNVDTIIKSIRNKGHELGNICILTSVDDPLDTIREIKSNLNEKFNDITNLKINTSLNDFNPDAISNFDTFIITFPSDLAYSLSLIIIEHFQNQKLSAPTILTNFKDYNPLEDDTLFCSIVDNLEKKSPWDREFYSTIKSYAVYQLLQQALLVDGDCLEFGCFQGWSASFLLEMITQMNLDKKVYLFDSWEGMPSTAPGIDPYYIKGDFKETSLSTIKNRLEPWKDKVEFIKGDICLTLPQLKLPSLCYVRIDVDLYEPTKVILEHTYSHTNSDAIYYLDDYVTAKTVGERLAVDIFLKKKREYVSYLLGNRAYFKKI